MRARDACVCFMVPHGPVAYMNESCKMPVELETTYSQNVFFNTGPQGSMVLQCGQVRTHERGSHLARTA